MDDLKLVTVEMERMLTVVVVDDVELSRAKQKPWSINERRKGDPIEQLTWTMAI